VTIHPPGQRHQQDLPAHHVDHRRVYRQLFVRPVRVTLAEFPDSTATEVALFRRQPPIGGSL
jgi:hypothetical protein